jgi:hypothetical protein
LRDYAEGNDAKSKAEFPLVASEVMRVVVPNFRRVVVGCRAMSATASVSNSLTPDDIQWIPSTILQPVHLKDLFANEAPLTVDYGCGEGAFVLAMAQRHPEQNFLATERLVGRVEKVCKTAAPAWVAQHQGVAS